MFTSRLTIMATAMISGLLLFASCEKENENTANLPEGAMKIFAESSQNDNTKTTVDGIDVRWVENDEISVNGETKLVAFDEGVPYLLNVSNSSTNLCAGFPASIVTGYDAALGTATVTTPTEYTYTVQGDKQKLDIPMVAYTAQGAEAELHFKHICSALDVKVSNNLGTAYLVDSIIVTSSSAPLSATVTFNLTGDEPTLRGVDNMGYKIKMNCNGLSVANSGNKTIQIPVLMNVTSASTVTVRIYGQPASTVAFNNGKVDAAAKIVYTNSTEIQLLRKKVYTAPCTIKSNGPTITRIYPTFSVSSTRKVYFSKGNLQYIASPSPTWKFADYQWDSRRGDNNSISDSYTGAIDLFGWGTGTAPTTTSTTDGDYASFNEWGNRTLYGSTNWRTLTSAEWKYLLDTRSGNRFVKAVVNSRNGIIIFPDNYTPSVSFSDINSTSVPYTTNPVSNWSSLEADGCIFLPSTGYRNGTSTSATSSQCAYWTADAFNSANAYRISCTNEGFSYDGATTKKHYGHAVRLVQNAN